MLKQRKVKKSRATWTCWSSWTLVTSHDASTAMNSNFPVRSTAGAESEVPNLQLECEQKNPRGYSDSCQGTLAPERDILEDGYVSRHKRRRYSRITKSVQRPTTSQNEALRESEEQMELELFTLAVPTDGADTPSFVNAWKQEDRTQAVVEKWDEVVRQPNLEQT